MASRSSSEAVEADGGGGCSVARDAAVVFMARMLLVLAVAVGLAASAAPPADSVPEYAARGAELPREDFDGRLRLADEARQSNQPDQAQELYRQVLAISPRDDHAYAALLELAAATPLTADSPSFRTAKKLLSPRFREYQTKRFIVLSDADSKWTTVEAEHLERAHHQFQRVARRLGLRTLPLRHKLLCILFEKRDDYQRFALTGDGVAEPWMNGYYSPRNDWIVFYQVESNPSIEEARTRLGEMQDSLRALDRRAADLEGDGHDAEADVLRETVAQRKRHLQHESDRVNLFASQVAVATTIHEATHQLLFHTGVQSPQVQYPLWICEGLATSFETETPKQAFGPDFEFAPRREVFDEMLTEGKLMPLRELITITAVPEGDLEAMQVLYHQSYALVTWMYRYRRDELGRFIEAMAQETGHAANPKRLRAVLENCFGDVDKLESLWLRQEQARVAKSSKAAVSH